MDRRQARESDPGSPPAVVYIHQGTVSEGESFFSQHDPSAPAIADPTRSLYSAFGLSRATLGQLFSPSVLSCGLRAARKGHSVGLPMGDPFLLSGQFLIASGQITWSHLSRHAADDPDPATIPRPSSRAG